MKQWVSRRRRCWTLLVQMDPVNHLSEGHRSDMLLGLSGLTREEHVRVQASVNNERDFDRVADASSSNIHVSTSERVQDEQRAKAKTDSNMLTIQTLVGAQHANLTSVEDYDYYDEDMDESAHAYQAHNNPVDPGSDDVEEAPDYDDDEENETFSSYAALDDVTVRQLNWMRLLFLQRSGTIILTLRGECTSGTSECTSLRKENGKCKGKGKG